MRSKLSYRAVTFTLIVGGMVTYLLCIFGDLIFGWRMYQIWTPLLPGFTWPFTLVGFFLGLVWLLLYSFYFGALIVWPYNWFVRRYKT